MSGPFQGMHYPVSPAEGCYVPRLLGCYEQELHPWIEDIGRHPYDVVIDVGCAEGYYAIGFARLMPQCRVFAFDTNEVARSKCLQMAAGNGVAERVTVGTLFDAEAMERIPGGRRLLFCDIEGAEAELLDPARIPGLAQTDVIVETHPAFVPGILDTIAQRFASTHAMEIVEPTLCRTIPLAFVRAWPEIQQLAAVWEMRGAPTPWVRLTARR